MGACAVGDGAVSWNQNPAGGPGQPGQSMKAPEGGPGKAGETIMAAAGGPGGQSSLLKMATKQQWALRAAPVAARKILS